MQKLLAFIFITLFFLPCLITAQQPDPLLSNAFSRPARLLNGQWHYIVDPYQMGYYNYRYFPFDQMDVPNREAYFMNTYPNDKSDRIEYDFAKAPTLQVPGDWNSQKSELLYYEGSIWYQTDFDYYGNMDDRKVMIYFGAVNYEAEVYLNGTKIGTHTGGFTPFNFEVSDLLKEKGNFLIVKVDNSRKKEGIPTLNTDWWNYGGITRDVKLITLPNTFIEDYRLQLSPNDDQRITGYVQLNGQSPSNQQVSLEIKELNLQVSVTTDAEGLAKIDIPAKNIRYWSLEAPVLYDVVIKSLNDRFIDQIGFRTIKTQGTEILLNNQKIFLKGISIHEEMPQRQGRAFSQDDAKYLLEQAKELGCNYVRLAHYPHSENMARLADQMGMLIWEEIPVYWTIEWNNPSTFNNAQQQLSELIRRDQNRAAVIIWSMANETPVTPERNQFLQNLITFARQMDSSRLISAALEQQSLDNSSSIRTIQDPLAEFVDVLSFNQYIGWYDGLPNKAQNINWRFIQNKPVIISEFGAGALYGYHADPLTRWSEEYQEYVYEENLRMISRIPAVQGISPWILFDFRSPRRNLTGIQDGWNRKGLLSNEGEKKKAYFVLQKFYQSKSK